jgi:hypothetical protein
MNPAVQAPRAKKVFWMPTDPVEIVTYISVAYAVFSAAAIAWVVLRGR